jgi:hypothetical protein
MARTLAILAAVTLSGCQKKPTEQWLPLTKFSSKANGIYAIDTTSVREAQGKVMVTSMGVYAEDDPSQIPGESPVTHVVGVMQFDCEKREGGVILSITFHRDNTSTRETNFPPPQLILPNSRFEAVMDYACNHRK